MPTPSPDLTKAIVLAALLCAALLLYLQRFAAGRRWLPLLLGALLLDQGSKALVLRTLVARGDYYREAPLFGGWLKLLYEENRALGFGGRGAALWLATLVCVGALLLLYPRLARRDYRMTPLTQTAAAFITGGLLGSLLDRVRLGYVIDFLDFGKSGNYLYNFADLFCLLGLGLLGLRAVQWLRENLHHRPMPLPEDDMCPVCCVRRDQRAV